MFLQGGTDREQEAEEEDKEGLRKRKERRKKGGKELGMEKSKEKKKRKNRATKKTHKEEKSDVKSEMFKENVTAVIPVRGGRCAQVCAPSFSKGLVAHEVQSFRAHTPVFSAASSVTVSCPLFQQQLFRNLGKVEI